VDFALSKCLGVAIHCPHKKSLSKFELRLLSTAKGIPQHLQCGSLTKVRFFHASGEIAPTLSTIFPLIGHRGGRTRLTPHWKIRFIEWLDFKKTVLLYLSTAERVSCKNDNLGRILTFVKWDVMLGQSDLFFIIRLLIQWFVRNDAGEPL
jgi:hypothetical protein